jgi:hypothetical protein
MKKYIISGIAVLAIAAVAVINITLSNGKTNSLSDLQLANVEALAQESNSSMGYHTTKTVTVYYYDSEGRLTRTESWTEPCCSIGGIQCSGNSCF